jgi:hypothetical protein
MWVNSGFLLHCASGTFFDSSRFLLLIDVDGTFVKHAVRNALPNDDVKRTYWGNNNFPPAGPFATTLRAGCAMDGAVGPNPHCH